MLVFQNPVLEELALSSYRTFIRAGGYPRIQYFALRKVIIAVHNDLRFTLDREPTVNEVRELERRLIEAAEREFAAGQVPIRPHGL